MADKILSIVDGLHDELPSTQTAKAGRILITTDRGEMYYEPEDKKRVQINPQSDWTQNDETANDYVKNRPGGYVGLTEILPETTLDFTDSNKLYLTNCPLIEVGVTYTVTFDGTEYELVGRNDSAGMGYICIGNELHTWGGTDTGEPFIIYNEGGGAPTIWISSSTTLPCTYNIKIKAVALVKINEKYLDIKNTNIVNGSAVGSLRTVGSIEENSSYTMGGYAFAEGADTTASGWNSHAEGNSTTASGDTSHAEGNGTTASGDTSHAEGNGTTASGYYSHAEGVHSEASGTSSHAEGSNTTAGLRGFRVTACEKLTDTTGTYTLRSVTGLSTNQRYSVHLSSSKENCGKITAIDTTNKKITVDGYPDIALGSGIINYLTIVNKPNLGDRVVSGDDSHAEGYFTTASGNYQHAQGKYNIVDTSNTYADIIGNGSFNTRSNAATVDWQGNAWYAGDVYVGSTSGTNRDEGSKKLATEEYVDTGLTSKVDKVDGKGLSTNDFTNEYKTKLDGIESGANKTIVDSELSDTSTNPVQNKIINAALGNINTALDRIIELQNSLIGGN